MQVYAVLYEPSGGFLLGYKLDKGYYFWNAATTTGHLVPQGQPLNGGDNWALPGGRRETGETLAEAARREFFEETAAAVPPGASATERTFSHSYAAVYFRVDASAFDTVASTVITRNLPSGLLAKDEVASGRITHYDDIAGRYPDAPRDNELGSAVIWNVKDPTDWSVIAQWQGDPTIGWYYEILHHLRGVIFAFTAV